VPSLDSVTVTASDLAASLAFYDAALGALGLTRVSELVDEEEENADVEAVGWDSTDGPGALWVVGGSVATSGLHVRFRAESRDQVETFHAQAVATGGRTFTAPRRWALYRRGEFNAIVVDPDGNLVEAVAAE
jgi:catechol 2,3-dioxygenase-like lactoylglutathione lyase family enzyme